MMIEMVIHYLLPSGERVSITTSHARLQDRYVEFKESGVTRRIPWGRVLCIDETHRISGEELEQFTRISDDELEQFTVRDDMGQIAVERVGW